MVAVVLIVLTAAVVVAVVVEAAEVAASSSSSILLVRCPVLIMTGTCRRVACSPTFLGGSRSSCITGAIVLGIVAVVCSCRHFSVVSVIFDSYTCYHRSIRSMSRPQKVRSRGIRLTVLYSLVLLSLRLMIQFALCLASAERKKGGPRNLGLSQCRVKSF